MDKINHSNNSIYILKIIWSLINKKRRTQLFLLIFVMIISSITELITLASVVPFLKVLTDPGQIYNSKILNYFLGNILQINSPDKLLLPVTLVFGFSAIFSALIRLISIYLNQYIAAKIGNDISSFCYLKTLNRSYLNQIQSNSSKTITAIINQVDYTVIIINFFLNLVASIFISVAIISALFITNWKVALTATIFSLISYLQISYISRKRLLSNSKVIANALKFQIKNLQETLGSIREVIMNNLQERITIDYQIIDLKRRIRIAENETLQSFPKFILEALGLMMISLFAYFIVSRTKNVSDVVSTLGLLTLGSQRLLPNMQKIYVAWTSIKANSASVIDIKEIIDFKKEGSFNKSKSKLNFRKKIRLQNISYQYSKNGPEILKSIDLDINKGECIGIKGETGSGKSTLLDIILGLLKPTKGEIFVDDISISENINEWRGMISHVPQDIYLIDDSIINNITFGTEQYLIDKKRVLDVCKIAKVNEFVEKFPKKYETIIGEKGINLSGGQLQRIGIARALYSNKKILILDEATSALDINKEKQVIDAILSKSNLLTIIMVAHRLDTLKNCDSIITIKDKKLIKSD